MAQGELKLMVEARDGRTLLKLAGRMTQATVGPIWRAVGEAVQRAPGTPVTLDLAEAPEGDSAGAALVIHVRELCGQAGRELEVQGVSPQMEQLLDLVRAQDLSTPDWPPHSRSFFVCIGEATIQLGQDVRTIISFIGELALALVQALRRPARVRWRDTIYYMERTGADALPIMGLISFLVGLILAFLGYNQLHQYGGDVFVADGVAYGMARVFGPLMVAILCAGRSGSAFASEIGTMKVAEEIDALDVMALERARFLVVPKVVALVLMMPLLVLYTDLGGMVGGFAVAVLGMGLAGRVYVQRSIEVLTIWTVASGLVKSLVFAVVVSAVGCLRGLQTRQGAQAVGEVTTSAVVSGFFLIVVVEGLFAVVFHYLGL